MIAQGENVRNNLEFEDFSLKLIKNLLTLQYFSILSFNMATSSLAHIPIFHLMPTKDFVYHFGVRCHISYILFVTAGFMSGNQQK